MGDPKRQGKKYKVPSHPWEADRIKEEGKLLKEYGLVNKKEIWRSDALLRKWQTRAREIISLPEEQRVAAQQVLFRTLNQFNILPKNAQIDDVLALTIRDVLERRLQTQLYKQGLANTINQARQFIIHNKVKVNDRLINAPSYLVREKDRLSFVPTFSPKLKNVVTLTKKKEQPKLELGTATQINKGVDVDG